MTLRGNSAKPLLRTSGPFESADLEVQEVVGLEDLGQDDLAVEGGVGCVIADRAVVLVELDEAGVLDAVGLGGRSGKDDPLRDVLLGRVADLVVGLGQGEHPLDDRLVLVMARPALEQGAGDGPLKLVERELVVERGQDLAGKGAVDAQLEQLAEKQGLVVKRVRHLLRRRHEASRLVHPDAVLVIDRAAAERDRRDMALAGGAEAQQEPARALGQPRLVGVPDHRGIEQRRRFQRVLLGEVRADQHPAILAQRLVGQEVIA